MVNIPLGMKSSTVFLGHDLFVWLFSFYHQLLSIDYSSKGISWNIDWKNLSIFLSSANKTKQVQDCCWVYFVFFVDRWDCLKDYIDISTINSQIAMCVLNWVGRLSLTCCKRIDQNLRLLPLLCRDTLAGAHYSQHMLFL